MKALIVTSLVVSMVFLAGCKASHPTKVIIDPEFNPNIISSILLSPCISSISEGEDPDRESERITNRVLWGYISERSDHKFLGREQFRVLLRAGRLQEEFKSFKDNWITKHEVDAEFLKALKRNANANYLLIPSVYLWFKDEADYREEGTASTTQVGVMLTLIDFETGKIMWEGTDENYKEAVRTEGGRVRVATAGIHRRVSGVTATGRDMYAAPPYEDVVVLVVEVLVKAFPSRMLVE